MKFDLAVLPGDGIGPEVVAEAVKGAYDTREQTRGLKMVYEPKQLRFFQARFEPIA